ncbi:monoamine oxidase [Talaromyces proteolyticus]|uniref:Amine oxidase n=1 Tax=Talaromyces proteolyticus TaxID=1131652 RepID=A0AAD4Q0Z8_9EURO|nr:monoamine oxidase [Talaromyces proteolyticus]KAH8697982.1 monoamine oxidase [Talaromyces proteolyticus]
MADPTPFLHSHVCTVAPGTTVVYTAGQIGMDKGYKIPENDEEQVVLALENLRKCLEAAGATTRDIVKVTFYVVAENPIAHPSARLLAAFLNGHRPTSVCVPLPSLSTPGVKFEVEAIAAVRSLVDHKPLSWTFPPALTDVIVVGAGLSGLQAAYDIQKSGLSCVVLEARDRVGGKTYSIPQANGRGIIEAGGAWINDTNQSKVSSLAKRFGLEFVIQTMEGDSIMHEPGRPGQRFPNGQLPENLGLEAITEIASLFARLEELSLTSDITKDNSKHDDITLEEFIQVEGCGATAVANAAILTRALLALEPSEISALYFIMYCKNAGGLERLMSDGVGGGQYMRIRQGAQAIAEGLNSSLIPGSVHLSTPATAIIQRESGLLVEIDSGVRLRCKKVVVSIPTPLYSTIAFDPPLSDHKLQYSSRTKLGELSKIILVYDQPWWRARGLSGVSQSSLGPICATRDSSIDQDQHYSLTCWVSGEPARQWSKLPQEDRLQRVLGQIEDMFGDTIPVPIQILEKEWKKDVWSKGGPCPTTPPGILSVHGHALSMSERDIHFVGTETAEVWTGYMEGALRSGARGAEEVIKSLL